MVDEGQEPKKGPQGKPGGSAASRPATGRRAKSQGGAPSRADEPAVDGGEEAASGARPKARKGASAAARPADPELPELVAEVPPELADAPAVPVPSRNMTRKELTEQYQPYVRSIAGKIKKTLSKDIEFEDLVQYGMLGLFEAADRYDSKFGANFMTFAYYRIRGAIYDGLRGMGWVSRTEYQRYRFEMQANAYLSSMNDQTVATQPIKRSTEDEVGELADVVSGLVTIYVTALDAMEGFQIKDERGPSIEESLETLQARKLVAEAVAKLPEQEKTLLQLYYYQEMSLEDVGKKLGLSKSWTSRLHTRAIEKLSRLLRDLVTEYQEATGATPKSQTGGKSTQPTGPPNR